MRSELVDSTELPNEAMVPKEEQPFDIPAHWRWVKIGYLSKVVGGGTPKSTVDDYYENGTIPWITPADLTDYDDIYISRGRRNITEMGYESSSAKMLPKDSILFSSRAPIGYVAIAANDVCTNQGFKSFEPSEWYIPRYGYWYLKYAKHLVEKLASGTTFAEVSGTKIAELPFPLPPLDEQKRIVERIELLLGKIEEAKSDILYVRETFSSRRASVLSKAFCGELTDEWRVVNPNTETGDCLAQRLMQVKKLSASYDCEGPFDIPGTWKWMRFGDIFHVQVGSTPSRKVDEYWGGDNLWVSSGEVAFTRISDTKEKVTDKGVVESRLKLAPERSVLFAMIGEGKTRGQVAIAEKPVYHNQNVASIWVNEVDSEYVYYWLLSQYLNNRAIGSGNNQPAYNKSRVEDLLIPLPPAGEQHEVVRVINSFLTVEDKVVELLEMDNNIQTMQTSILSKAFSGGL